MKERKQKFFGLDQIIWRQTNRVEESNNITICKYLVTGYCFQEECGELIFALEHYKFNLCCTSFSA